MELVDIVQFGKVDCDLSLQDDASGKQFFEVFLTVLPPAQDNEGFTFCLSHQIISAAIIK